MQTLLTTLRALLSDTGPAGGGTETQLSKKDGPETRQSDQATEADSRSPTAEEALKTEDIRDDLWFKVYQARQQAKMTADQVDAEEICAEIERRIAADEFKLIEIPKNVTKAMKLVRKTNFDYAELGQLLNHSSTVTSEILQVANSVLHKGAVATAALQRALSRLDKKVLTSVLYVGCTRMFVKNKKGLEQITEDIVEHSYAVAHISKYLAQKYYHDADEACSCRLPS